MNKDMKYDAVIFDLDGTLLDTLEDLTDAVNFALRECKMKERGMDEVRIFLGNGIRNLMQRAVERGEDNPDFDRAFELFRRYYREHCNDKTRPYPGIQKMLGSLKEQGRRLAIVSNKADFAVKELCEIYFKDLVETAIGEREGIARKPAKDTVCRALLELGVTGERAVYVGDSEVDILTAKNAHLPCISVTWGFRDREFLAERGAVYFADMPEEILKLLEREL